jgi:hypothetical protein
MAPVAAIDRSTLGDRSQAIPNQRKCRGVTAVPAITVLATV